MQSTAQFLQGILSTPAAHQIIVNPQPSGAPNPVASGGQVSVSVAAQDSLGHNLSYSWQATCPAALGTHGSFSPSANVQAPTWTAPVNVSGILQSCALQVTAADNDGLQSVAGFSQNVSPGALPVIFGAVLPTTRFTQAGAVPGATAFASIVNAGPGTAVGCGVSLVTADLPVTLRYQTTDPSTNMPTGTPNTPADIPHGQIQSYVIELSATGTFPVRTVQLRFHCTNTADAPVVAKLNTLDLGASTTPVPDTIALVAVGPPNDGTLRLASVGAFAVAVVNVGASGLMTVFASAGALPVTLTLCETNPDTGECLAPATPSVQTQINTGATPTFAVFVDSGVHAIPWSPATNRIQVILEGGGGGGGTSVAVCTQPLCPP
jgi:hypothetical protein